MRGNGEPSPASSYDNDGGKDDDEEERISREIARRDAAYFEGATARAEGWPLFDNPHRRDEPRDVVLAAFWDQGWMDEERRRLRPGFKDEPEEDE